MQSEYDSISKEQTKTDTELAYAEIISYNPKNLTRELQNESRQHNRQQSETKRREEEIQWKFDRNMSVIVVFYQKYKPEFIKSLKNERRYKDIMENNNLSYEKIQKNKEKMFLNEKYRKEKHDSSCIIFNHEISPVQMYQNLMDNTVFTYKNRVPKKGSKVITSLKGIRRKRIVGSIIQ